MKGNIEALAHWQNEMGLSGISIVPEQIFPDQVSDEKGGMEIGFIGISRLNPQRIATLYYVDKDKLTEEAIAHELAHLLRPEWSDPKDHHLINEETQRWLNGKGRSRWNSNWWNIEWNGSLWIARANS